MKNTLQKGTVRYIVFQEDAVWYAVALEFNIVVQGDDKVEVMASLFQAVRGYLTAAKRVKLRPSVLNQTPDREYEYLWSRLEHSDKGRPKSLQGVRLVEPSQVFAYGFAPATALARA